MIDRVLNGRYRLLTLLGEGGMAMVYEAEDVLLGRRVAVKVLRGQFASDAAFLARFQREARASASLAHPNIVAVYDVGSDAGTQYIVMELVPGRTLKELIQEQAPLNAARIIDLGRQICEGLQYAHQHGIVHRDVKPHNILVSQDGRARIADFGIAVALGASSLTQSGYIVGSAHYVSPEQAQGQPTTALSDLYSTGVALYEMATGRLPFEGETSVVVALKQIQETPLPPRRLNPRLPESLQAVILQAMAKAPSERYDSAARMAQALLACTRAGLEATQPHQVATARPARTAPTLPRDEAALAPGRPLAPEDRRSGSGSWAVLVVVFAAFLCVLGSIPLGIMAYSGGTLARFVPGAVPQPSQTAAVGAPPTGVPTAALPTGSPTRSPTATPTGQPTATITPTATAAPIAVPSLIGMPLNTARQVAQAAGLEVVSVAETYSTKYPIASVVSQKPEPGARVDRGTRVEVTMSLGKETVTVPRAVGDTASTATGKLQAAGLQWKIVEENNDRVPGGVVISQAPAPDVTADKGSEVVLTVSKGREKVAVPSLVGLPEAEAQSAIEKAGLAKNWPNYQDFTFVPPGHVLSQEPKPGTMVEKGTTVYIAVRKPQPTAPAKPTAPSKAPGKS